MKENKNLILLFNTGTLCYIIGKKTGDIKMHWMDIILLIALVIPTFIGLKQGLIKAVLSLAGLIVGVVLAGNFYRQLANVFGFIDNPHVANVIAYVVILVAVLVIAAIAAKFLKAFIKVIMLGWVNSLGGAVFGFVIGMIFLGAILAIWEKYFGPDMLIESFIAGFLLDKFPLVLGLLPKEFNAVREFFK
jgi:membrane protein required for colicin V production